MGDSISIEEAKVVTQEIYEAFQYLTPQLSSTSSIPSYAQLGEIVSSPATLLFLARDTDLQRIVGTLTLVIFRIPTGVRAWIEDVVVDSAFRGKGIGGQLCNAAIQEAKKVGSRTIDLTSRPSRVAAHRLYLSVGFKIRDTNVYRITFN